MLFQKKGLKTVMLAEECYGWFGGLHLGILYSQN